VSPGKSLPQLVRLVANDGLCSDVTEHMWLRAVCNPLRGAISSSNHTSSHRQAATTSDHAGLQGVQRCCIRSHSSSIGQAAGRRRRCFVGSDRTSSAPAAPLPSSLLRWLSRTCAAPSMADGRGDLSIGRVKWSRCDRSISWARAGLSSF
jgi:hypothetical protein